MLGLGKKRLGWLAGIALLVVAAGSGGVWYVKVRNADPFRKALALMDRNEYREARVELRVALRAQPNNPGVRLALARVLAKLADPVAAEREFRIAAGLGADKWEVLPELGESMIAQAKYQEILAQLPPTAPNPVVAAKDLALRAAAQVALGDVAAAQQTLELVKRVAPSSVEASLIEARLAAARGDLAATETNVEAVLKRDPKQVEALLMREQLLTSKRDYGAALQVASQAVEAAPWSAMARIDRAYQLMFNNQDAKAQGDVDAVLANQPQFIDAIYLNGILKARRGDYEGAGLELARLENAGSRFPQALLYLAKVSKALGHKEAAAEQARRYNALVPKDADGVKMVAVTALDLGKPKLALPIVEAAVAQGQVDAETLSLVGRLDVATGNAAGAFNAFQKAVAASPDDAAILANYGMAQMRQGDLAAGAITLEKSLQINPKLTEAEENLALAYIQQGRLDKAQAAIDDLRRAQGDTPVLGVLTSGLQERQGDKAAARATLLASLQKFPDSIPVKIALARLFSQDNAPGQAVRLYLEVLSKQPANLDVLKVFLPILVQSGQAAAAIGPLEAAHKADPGSPTFMAMLADTYTATGSPQKALALIEEAQAKDAFTPAMLPSLARAQAAVGQTDAAKQSYSAILKDHPGDLATRLEQIALLTGSRDTAAAEASLRDAVAAAPGDMVPLEDLVVFVNAARGYDAAVKVIDELKTGPANMPFATALKGDMLMRANRFADAAAAYLAEFQAAPSQPLVLRYATAAALAGHDDQAAAALRSWLKTHPDSLPAAATLARLAISAKRWPEAEALVNAVLAKAPNDPLVLTSLARIYLGTNDTRALAVAQRAYLLSPSPQAGDTLGWVMTRQGDVKAAIQLLRLARQRSPDDLAIRYHLAAALAKDGQSDEAVAILKDVAKGGISFDERADALALLKQIQEPAR